ncbi:ImmA/IrrE family metallo-endopeptidase [Bacillus sp. FJAT-52991]|uniref:ImmA/IrrE family metallo-endopeptidase n=1 Tax=Bacillus kandeliae TaxID=3129297 RepID=A0ABZ2NCS3_9BACI
MNHQKQTEMIAEAFAASFIEDTIGRDIFIGSHIERILADQVTVIYQYVEDQAYFGAAIQHQNGEQFVALNTYHSLRLRYFTAAHELWHLLEGSQYQDENFDHERAADRFAAAIMLPKALTLELWRKFKKLYNAEQAILQIADLAAVPYVAVLRRLAELGENVSGLASSEEEWMTKRSPYNLPESVLDQPMPFTRFSAYEQAVDAAMEQAKLDNLAAANKLTHFAPEKAKKYQEETLLAYEENKDEA